MGIAGSFSIRGPNNSVSGVSVKPLSSSTLVTLVPSVTSGGISCSILKVCFSWISFKKAPTDLTISEEVLFIGPIFFLIKRPVSSSTKQIGTKGVVPVGEFEFSWVGEGEFSSSSSSSPSPGPGSGSFDGSDFGSLPFLPSNNNKSVKKPAICLGKFSIILVKRHLICSLISILISKNWNLWFGYIISAAGPRTLLICFVVNSNILLKTIFIYFAILGTNLAINFCICSPGVPIPSICETAST